MAGQRSVEQRSVRQRCAVYCRQCRVGQCRVGQRSVRDYPRGRSHPQNNTQNNTHKRGIIAPGAAFWGQHDHLGQESHHNTRMRIFSVIMGHCPYRGQGRERRPDSVNRSSQTLNTHRSLACSAHTAISWRSGAVHTTSPPAVGRGGTDNRGRKKSLCQPLIQSYSAASA